MEMRLLICLFVLSLKPDVGLARWVGVAGFMVVCLVMSADLVFPFRICFIAAFGDAALASASFRLLQFLDIIQECEVNPGDFLFETC